MELTRKQVIEILEKADSTVYKEPKTKTAQALEYAISSLKTDEAYQLMYEGIENIIVPKDLTNGDVIKLMFPDAGYDENQYYTVTMDNRVTDVMRFVSQFDLKWWNSPYKGAKDGKDTD